MTDSPNTTQTAAEALAAVEVIARQWAEKNRQAAERNAKRVRAMAAMGQDAPDMSDELTACAQEMESFAAVVAEMREKVA